MLLLLTATIDGLYYWQDLALRLPEHTLTLLPLKQLQFSTTYLPQLYEETCKNNNKLNMLPQNERLTAHRSVKVTFFLQQTP
jgi:hypothetical protein